MTVEVTRMGFVFHYRAHERVVLCCKWPEAGWKARLPEAHTGAGDHLLDLVLGNRVGLVNPWPRGLVWNGGMTDLFDSRHKGRMLV